MSSHTFCSAIYKDINIILKCISTPILISASGYLCATFFNIIKSLTEVESTNKNIKLKKKNLYTLNKFKLQVFDDSSLVSERGQYHHTNTFKLTAQLPA